MSYFQNFNPVAYKFGDETTFALFTNLTQYVDLFDEVKSQTLFLDDYTIPRNERPDQTAFKLYGDASYYWTFYLVNDPIRTNGWPLTLNEIQTAAQKRYPHRMVTVKLQQPDVIDYYDDDNKPITRTKIVGTAPDNFEVGSIVTGSTSGTKGRIIKRDLALGTFVIDTENVVTRSEVTDQVVSPNANGILELERTDATEAETFTSPKLWNLLKDDELVDPDTYQIEINPFGRKVTLRNIPFDPGSTYKLTYYINTKNLSDGTFVAGEELSYRNPAGTDTSMLVHGEMPQYLGTHHYEDANGLFIDINPLDQTKPSGAIEKTMKDYLNDKNEELRQIKVIKPTQIDGLVRRFRQLMGQ